MTRAYLGLGSNLGDRLAHLQDALDALEATDRIELRAVSDVYETAPVGGPDQDDFLNAVVAIETDLTPRALLAVALHVESLAARVRTVRWGPAPSTSTSSSTATSGSTSPTSRSRTRG